MAGPMIVRLGILLAGALFLFAAVKPTFVGDTLNVTFFVIGLACVLIGFGLLRKRGGPRDSAGAYGRAVAPLPSEMGEGTQAPTGRGRGCRRRVGGAGEPEVGLPADRRRHYLAGRVGRWGAAGAKGVNRLTVHIYLHPGPYAVRRSIHHLRSPQIVGHMTGRSAVR